MIEANPQGLIQWSPALMKRYGSVVDGGAYNGSNLYRLIWAPSRAVTLMLDRGATTLPKYVAVEPLFNPAVWVLEKWRSCADIAGEVTQADWNAPNSEWLMQGPYPLDGDYELCTQLAVGVDPASANIDKLVVWVEAGKKFSPQQNALALQNKMDEEDKTKRRVIKDKIDDRVLPFAGEAWASGSSVRSKRNTKVIETKHSANELGLPTKPGNMGLSPIHKPVTYQVPLGEEG